MRTLKERWDRTMDKMIEKIEAFEISFKEKSSLMAVKIMNKRLKIE